MMSDSETTYTPDGETEYALVYDIPEDAADSYTVWLETPDGSDKQGVSLDEFRAEWSEFSEREDTAVQYERERARNGWGIQ